VTPRGQRINTLCGGPEKEKNSWAVEWEIETQMTAKTESKSRQATKKQAGKNYYAESQKTFIKKGPRRWVVFKRVKGMFFWRGAVTKRAGKNGEKGGGRNRKKTEFVEKRKTGTSPKGECGLGKRGSGDSGGRR